MRKPALTLRAIAATLLLCLGAQSLASLDEGKLAAGRGDFVSAEKAWRAAAKSGDADAKYHLGALLITDKLGAPKVEEGVRWWREAALQGHADAANTLGLIYYTGVGELIKKDLPRAARAFEMAAKQGQSAAQVSLAMMLMDGQGVKADRAAAMAWMEKAAQQGNARAQFNLGSFYVDGRAGQKDVKLAQEWLVKSAEGGFAPAQLNLARLLLTGERTGERAGDGGKTARYWYEKAANQGVPEAAYAVGIISQLGADGKRDAVAALEWFERAAKGGNRDAMYRLGQMYADGDGVAKSAGEAYMWLALASAGGSGDAPFLLAAVTARMEPADIVTASAAAQAWLAKNRKGSGQN